MMKATMLIFLSIVFFSCEQSKSDTHEPTIKQNINFTFDNVSWNSKILPVIDSFILENNCQKCIYELYVNKVLPNYVLINLKARSPSEEYMRIQDPLLMSVIRGKLFYIYTGLEDVLGGDKKRIYIATNTSVVFYKNWTVIMGGDSLKIKKQNGGYPFFPSTDENPYYNKLGMADSANFK